MDYKILFYSVIALFFIIAILALFTAQKGGYASIAPISGAGILFMRTRTKMYDEAADSMFISNKLTLALIFIFIAFEWEEDVPHLDLENKEQESKLT